MTNQDSEKEWIYYETLVPGYVEKYSMSGIRDRNKKLLDRLRKSTSPLETKKAKDLLAENNLPLAKYIAERFKQGRDWNKDTKEDAFSECCLAMVQFLNKMGTTEDDLNQKFFQIRLTQAMWAHLYEEYVRKGNLHDLDLVPFTEEHDVEAADTANHLNMPLVLELVGAITSCHNRDIFVLYVYGDPQEENARPRCFDEIATFYDMPKNSVCNSVTKTTKKLVTLVRGLIRSGYYKYEDFFGPDIRTQRKDIEPVFVPKIPEPAWFEKYL